MDEKKFCKDCAFWKSYFGGNIIPYTKVCKKKVRQKHHITGETKIVSPRDCDIEELHLLLNADNKCEFFKRK